MDSKIVAASLGLLLLFEGDGGIGTAGRRTELARYRSPAALTVGRPPDPVARGTRVDLARRRTCGPYAVYPEVRATGGSEADVAFVAVRRRTRRAEVVVAPSAVDTLCAHADAIGSAAAGVYAYGEPTDVTRASMHAVELAQREGLGAGLRQVGAAWRSALGARVGP